MNNPENSSLAVQRLFMVCAVAAGLARALAHWIGAAFVGDGLELLYSVIDFGLILGLVGFYQSIAVPVGLLGGIVFSVTLCALAFIAGPDANVFGVSAWAAGAPIVAVGMALLTALAFMQGQRCGLAAAAFIAALLLGAAAMFLSGGAAAAVNAVSGSVFGFGFVALGVFLFRQLDQLEG